MSVVPEEMMGSLSDLPAGQMLPISDLPAKQPGGYQPPAPTPAQFGANPQLVAAQGAAPAAAAPRQAGLLNEKALQQRYGQMATRGMDIMEEEEPKYRAAIDEDTAARNEQLAALKKPSPPPPIKQAAPEYADFAKQVSPFLILATVLGGKVAKLSGQNMLGALNGMVEGTNEGNMDKYQSAYKAYQDNRKAQKEEYEEMLAYNTAMNKYAGDRFAAKHEIAQNSMAMYGVGEEIAKTGINGWNAIEKNEAAMQAQDARLRALESRMSSKTDAQIEKDTKDYVAASQGTSRLASAKSQVSEMLGLLDQIEAKYGSLARPGTIAEIMRKYNDDPLVTRFSALQGRATIASLGSDLPSGARANMWFEKFEQSQQSKLWDAPIDQIRQNGRELLRTISGTLQEKQAARKAFAQNIRRLDPGTNIESLYQQGAGGENEAAPVAQTPKSFANEKEALASGVKGDVIIGGRKAHID